MAHKFILLLIISFISVSIKSQTSAEAFEKLNLLYLNTLNRVNNFSGKVTDEESTKALKEYTSSVDLWSDINNDESYSNKKAASTLTVLISHYYAVFLSLKKEYSTSEMIFLSIESFLEKFKPATFPITYRYNSKDYKITYDDFNIILAEYYYYTASALNNNFKFKNSLTYYEKYLQHAKASDQTKLRVIKDILLANSKVKFLSSDSTSLLSDEQVVIYVNKYFQQYYSLNEETRKKVNESTDLQPLNILNSVFLIKDILTPSPQVLKYVGQIANLIAKHEKQSLEVLTLFEICFKNFKTENDNGNAYVFDKSISAFDFENLAQEYALTLLKGEGKEMALNVGLKALKEMSQATHSKCENYTIIANAYAKWGDSKTERVNKKLAENCVKDKAKIERKKVREYYLDNSNLNTYFGINVLPLLNSNEKRDYGGVVNFTRKRFALELSYLQINQNKENIFDLWIKEIDDARQDNVSRWDGYYAHIQPKYFESNHKNYVGILLGYAQKTFDPMQVNITNNDNGLITSGNFNPSVKQYIAMINIGAMLLGKGGGIDMYWGIGATYNQLNHGFDQDVNKFKIDNPLLENRKSPYFGYIMRFGINFGINIGRGN